MPWKTADEAEPVDRQPDELAERKEGRRVVRVLLVLGRVGHRRGLLGGGR